MLKRSRWLRLVVSVPLGICMGLLVVYLVRPSLAPDGPVLPSAKQRLGAIGPTAELDQTLRRAFDPADDVAVVPDPGPSDWLANHPEPGQTFAQFVQSKPNQPDATRTTIYLQPLGSFTDGKGPPLETLKQFTERFFLMPVLIRPVMAADSEEFTRRTNPHTGKNQLLTKDILLRLIIDLPEDAFFVLAVTMEDLYPSQQWNFVFGQASLTGRAGVFSFARYDPRFWGGSIPDDLSRLILVRSCKVLAHEAGHMFGMKHCIYFHCLMNGSNHLAESDSRPMHLCPVCLRKLNHSLGFDVVERYEGLRAFYKEAGIDTESRWMEGRLRRIASGK